VVPVLFVQAPGLVFSPVLACVPVVNVVLMIRAALTGSFPWVPILLTTMVSLLLLAVCVRLGAYFLQFETVLVGSHRGFRWFLVRQILRRPARAS
jgi:hypothetical protein